MKIALISKLWEPTDPYSTGGTGVLVGNLAEGLIKRGHQVTLFATGNSRTSARLISITPKPYSSAHPYSELTEYHHLSRAFQMADQFDIMDCHVEHKGLLFSSLVSTPVVHTIEYGEFFTQELQLLKRYKHQNFIAISHAIAKEFKFLNFQGIVHNGLDLSRFPYNSKPQKYLLFLARLSPQKGPDLAIKTAKTLKIKLILAGKTSPADESYLQQKIFPQIDGQQIKYLGEINFRRKTPLLKNALTLLHPHQYFEAFGLAMIESQACGTPVIAFNRGAAQEVIQHGKTGFVVNNTQQMIKAVKKVDSIKRQDCRYFIEKNFNLNQMITGYEKIYQKIIQQKKS